MILLVAEAVEAQDRLPRTGQLWIDYDPTWPLGERWTVDADIQTRLIDSNPFSWQTRLQPTVQYSPAKWVDLTSGVWFIHTSQFEASDLFEIRPTAGVRLKRDIWHGMRLSNYLRAELRIQRNLDTTQTISAGRLRNRIQAMMPINHRSLSEDNTWSAFADAEWFWQRDPSVDDGFNSRRRYRAGTEWRKNARWSYSFFYAFQRSRNTVNVPFAVDDILGVSVIQTFD